MHSMYKSHKVTLFVLTDCMESCSVLFCFPGLISHYYHHPLVLSPGGAVKFGHPWRVIPPDWHHFGARRSVKPSQISLSMYF